MFDQFRKEIRFFTNIGLGPSEQYKILAGLLLGRAYILLSFFWGGAYIFRYLRCVALNE
jgi:hypothetical protein